jgi:hypothetical protein
VIEIGLHSFLKSSEDLRENSVPFADHGDIRYARSEKKGVLKGHLRAAHDELYHGKIPPDPLQQIKGALDVPQIESAADEIGLPVQNLFEKMPVVELLFFRRQPLTLRLGGKTGALQSVEQIAGGYGQILSCCRVVLNARQL